MTSEPADGDHNGERVWRIGRYRIEAVVGTGTFATVYRAFDERLEDTVAVKVLAENHSLDPEIRMRFLTEGRVLRRITSPDVVRVHDLGETERQQPYLVLEFAWRGTLAQRVRDLRATGWQPDAADLRAVAEPLARALDAMHAAGIVHRDVNPANILLTTRGAGPPAPASASSVVRSDERLVLADLGLCKDLARNSGYTSGGGTEGFRAPELRGGPAIIDRRADLWSLSAVMAWLATGSPPGDGAATAGLRGTARDLGCVLDRGLSDDPATRQPDALTWLAEVEAGLGQPVSPLSASRTAAQPVAGPTRPWRLRHSAWVLTSLLLGFTTWAGFLYIGIRAQRRGWLVAAALYGVAAVALFTIMVSSPMDDQGNYVSSWQDSVGTVVMFTLLTGGFVHALLANRTWLAWLAGSRPRR
ncbi:MAG TPA: serine/threonine-protein kinase [Acidimicrobiales bacterium]|nr:serine/threonine-protein kinase [Acidimicrobiales bacterium]